MPSLGWLWRACKETTTCKLSSWKGQLGVLERAHRLVQPLRHMWIESWSGQSIQSVRVRDNTRPFLLSSILAVALLSYVNPRKYMRVHINNNTLHFIAVSDTGSLSATKSGVLIFSWVLSVFKPEY